VYAMPGPTIVSVTVGNGPIFPGSAAGQVPGGPAGGGGVAGMPLPAAGIAGAALPAAPVAGGGGTDALPPGAADEPARPLMPLPAAPVIAGLPATVLPVVPLIAAGVCEPLEPARATPRGVSVESAALLHAAPAIVAHKVNNPTASRGVPIRYLRVPFQPLAYVRLRDVSSPQLVRLARKDPLVTAHFSE
jgi:hypothetical protein